MTINRKQWSWGTILSLFGEGIKKWPPVELTGEVLVETEKGILISMREEVNGAVRKFGTWWWPKAAIEVLERDGKKIRFKTDAITAVRRHVYRCGDCHEMVKADAIFMQCPTCGVVYCRSCGSWHYYYAHYSFKCAMCGEERKIPYGCPVCSKEPLCGDCLAKHFALEHPDKKPDDYKA
jgi:hypothetical protein